VVSYPIATSSHLLVASISGIFQVRFVLCLHFLQLPFLLVRALVLLHHLRQNLLTLLLL
jgi:hypothetical protein